MKVSYGEMFNQFLRVLLDVGFSKAKAELCARLFAEASRDGVYTHGLNRFPRFIEYIKNRYVNVEAEPEKITGAGALETWDGHQGAGNLNAHHCMARAIELARENGLGCVALRNTNHWMRGGSYGWQAAEAECIGICWTNTIPLLPPWGSSESKLGNNPLILAVPRPDGPIVLDIAMTMFSFGKIESYILKDRMLPVDGGFNKQGNLTRDPREIMDSKRPLPIGLWKGTGLALMLDLIATCLSGGRSTYHLGQASIESNVSQVFMAFDTAQLPHHDMLAEMLDEIIADFHSAKPVEAEDEIFYPGERVLKTRKENLEKGIPVEEVFWQQVLDM